MYFYLNERPYYIFIGQSNDDVILMLEMEWSGIDMRIYFLDRLETNASKS